MSASVSIVFPYQLYWPHPALAVSRTVLLIEHPLMFGKDALYPLSLHKQKLLLHRASMKAYEAKLQVEGYSVSYIDFYEASDWLQQVETAIVHCCEPTDYLLQKELEGSGLVLQKYASPNFLNTSVQNQEFFSTQHKPFMKQFYEWQRRRLDVLMEPDGTPTGGKFSFDTDNRKKLPAAERNRLSDLPKPKQSDILKDATAYVDQHFPQNPGVTEEMLYPYTHEEAEIWLQRFLEERLEKFGPYEDAIESDTNWLYHSVLTPSLNIGLLSPQQIIDTTLLYAKKHDVPIASLEGFLRQIIGWREFMRFSYEEYGVQMRSGNTWNHQQQLPDAFYKATTGVEPVDNCIGRVQQTGYCHHIERLMVLGGFMFLCEIHPTAIYKWFMELFVDSYDWVMVPNVYAMSQNSCGGLITTKPYFSGSSYIRKMSHYPKGKWCDIWDGLYWRFIQKHSGELRKNPRWAMMCSVAEKMERTKMQRHLSVADEYLQQLFS